MMRTIFADFNARTVAGHLRLMCVGSQKDMSSQGVRVGDWVWLSDGELVIGGQIATDEAGKIVGEPRWNTLVHLDDEGMDHFPTVFREFSALVMDAPDGPNVTTESRIFQLATIMEHIAPKPDTTPGYLSFRRAGALYLMGEYDLTLIEIEAAIRARPGDPATRSLYLETLRKVDLPRAANEAARLASDDAIDAGTLASCINVHASIADRASDAEFSLLGRRIIEWAARFELAHGRDRIRASTLAQVKFNVGLTLLRFGRHHDARAALDLAHATDPEEPSIGEAVGLDSFDHHAREIAARYREKAPMTPAAA